MSGPTYPYQIIFQTEPELYEALQFAAANLRPRKTRSAIIREALFAYLNREIPTAFDRPNVIAAE
jgi:predicted transcriptional regulator